MVWRTKTHGMSGDPLYRVWASMLQRCENPNDPAYENYGGRGIVVCADWHDFAKFAQDMAPRPAGMVLDRENNDGPYSPDNCRWATWNTSALNKRPRRRRTHCRRGHQFTEANTYLATSRGRPYQSCRECARDAKRAE